jgi:ribosomal protein S18 acetylase RimI-like enzyme
MNPVRHSRIDLLRVTDNDWRLWRGLRLAALEEAPYAFSQKLSDWTGTGDTEGRWRARLTTVPFNVVGYLDALEVGIVSGARPKGPTAQLVSMWVTPSARGKGVGNALINASIEWSRALGADGIHLDVFEDNEHAIRLYRRHGFVDRGRNSSKPDDYHERPERRMELLFTSSP